MLNRVVVCKFLLESLPSNPLSSSSTRSASATPSDIQSSGQGRSSSRYMKGLGHLLLSQTAMLKRARTQVDNLKKQLADEDSKFQEEMYVLKAQVEEKDRKLVMQAIEMESLRTTSIESYTRDREEGLVAGQSAAVAAFKASPEFAEEVFRQGSSFYADGFTVCAEQLKNLGNLPPDFDYNFLDMQVDGFGRIGGVGPSE
ncbi:hypothetical protein Salat_1182400 [Sesamum alatum]|uniref:Uncharacterized protein n=1 Tax=Sesamum alatum TaxID=300844 RepID=A0AAE2CNM1_9LAMI|nr:hypothetical protein Salat_1182400 [Sesamum alatum]